MIDVKIGDGKLALKESKVAVHYSGWLYDENGKENKGELFDTSFDLGEPLVFSLGQKQVIKGWDEGIPGRSEERRVGKECRSRWWRDH